MQICARGQNHPAPHADRGLEGGGARAGRARAAAAGGAPARGRGQSPRGRRRPPRNRRGGDRSGHWSSAEVRTPDADEAACRRYYEQNRSRFRSPDIYEAAHILFSAAKSDPVSYAQAREAAKAAAAILREQPERFAELARTHSACPSGAQGGNLGQIIAGQTTPEFEQALVALKPGTMILEPVATRYGFHIIRLDRKHDGRELPFELVSDRIAEYLRTSVQRRATAQYIARLASAARIDGIDLASAEALRVS